MFLYIFVRTPASSMNLEVPTTAITTKVEKNMKFMKSWIGICQKVKI